MATFLVLDTVGGANLEGYALRNVGSLHVGGGALADPALGVLQITGAMYVSGNYRKPNNTYSQGRNAGNTAWVDEWKINLSNQLETATPVNLTSSFGAVTGSFNGDTGLLARGPAVEIFYSSLGRGYIQAYDRTLGALEPLWLIGSAIVFDAAATLNSTLSVTGVTTFSDHVSVGDGKNLAWGAPGDTALVGHPTLDKIEIYTGAALRGQFIGGIFAWGTSVTTGAAVGDVVLANTKALRAVNAAATGTIELVSLDASNRLRLNCNNSTPLFVDPLLTGSAGAVATYLTVTTNGGTNYKIPLHAV